MTKVAIGRPLWAVALLLPLLSACAPGANNFAGNTIAEGPSGRFPGPAMQDNPSVNERRLAITHPTPEGAEAGAIIHIKG